MVLIFLQNTFSFAILDYKVYHSACILLVYTVYITFRIIFNGNDYADCDTNDLGSTSDLLDVVTPAHKWVLQDGDATNNNSTNTAYPTQLDEIGYFSTPTMNYTESALQSSLTITDSSIIIEDYWYHYWHGPFQRYLNTGIYDNSYFKRDCSRIGRRVHLRRFDARSDSNFSGNIPCHVASDSMNVQELLLSSGRFTVSPLLHCGVL